MDDPEIPAEASVKQPSELYTSVKQLADALHVSRQTIYDWFKLPGCPEKRADKLFDAAEWRAFAQSIGTKTDAGGLESDGQKNLKGILQEEELQLKNEQRRKKIEREDGLWTRNDQIAAELAPLIQEAKALLRAKFENELPSLYSADPAVQAKARALNKAAVDDVCRSLSAPLPCQGGLQGE